MSISIIMQVFIERSLVIPFRVPPKQGFESRIAGIRLPVLTLLAVLFLSCSASAVGFRPTLEIKAVQANDSKCAFEEYTNSSPPLIRGYRKQTTHRITSYDYSFAGTNGCSSGYLIISPDDYSLAGSEESDLTRVEIKSGPLCDYTNYYFGTFFTTEDVTDARDVQYTNPNSGCSPNEFDEWYSVYKEVNGSPQLVMLDDQPTWALVNGHDVIGAWIGNGCDNDPPAGTHPLDDIYTETNVLSWAFDDTVVVSPTEKTADLGSMSHAYRYCWEDDWDYEISDDVTLTLEDEFTTEDLMDMVRGKLPDWPAYWSAGSAFGHVLAWKMTDCTMWDGYEAKARIKVSFPTKAGFPYVLKHKMLRAKWVFVNCNNNPPYTWVTNISVESFSFKGTGSPIEIELPELAADDLNSSKVASIFWVFTTRRGLPDGVTGYGQGWSTSFDPNGNLSSFDPIDPYNSPPPGWDPFDDEVDDGEDEDDGGDDDDDDGGGGGGGGDDDGDDCESCNDGSCENGFAAASFSNQSGSIKAQFHMGTASEGELAGSLQLTAAFGGDALASSAALSFTAFRHDVEIVATNGVTIRQVKSPQGLADVITNSPYQFQIRFFPPAAVGSKVSGVYQLIGSALTTWTIVNPDGQTNANRLWIIRTQDGLSITNKLEADSNFRMSLIAANGQQSRRTWTEWDESVSPPARIVRKQFIDPYTGLTNREHTARYEQILTDYEVIVSSTTTAGGEERQTSYEYYADDTAPGRAGKLKKTVAADGSWQYFEYDSYGRVTREMSGFLNQIFTTDTNLCRSVFKDYTTLPPESGLLQWDYTTPRTEVEYLLGKEIHRTYRVEKTNESRVISCQTATAPWNATDNLVTITKLNSSGDWEGQLASVENPDGTMSFYAYATNSTGFHTNTVSSGLPNGGKTDITKGTRTTTVIDPAGQTLSVTTVDVASTITTDQTISSNPDSVGRYRKITYLDNTFTWTSYGCCGVETVTNRDGSVTSYDYDALGRKFMQSTDGITKFNYYDSAGRLYSAIRQGTNGDPITLFTRSFDAWGRVIHQTNAMLHVTSWAYLTNAATGGNLVIQTNADNGTIIQAYAIDGTLLKTTGTGVHPSRTHYDVEQDAGVWRAYSKEIKLDAAFADTGEWVKHYTDLAGRSYKTVYPDGATNVSYFNAQGELWKRVDADGNITLSTNINFNESYSVVDLDRDSRIDWNGPDRISKSVSDVTSSSLMGGNVRRTRSYAYASDGSSAETLVGTSETSTNGLKQWSVANGVTNKSQTVYATGGYRYVTNTAPDGAYTVSVAQKGRQLSVTQKDALNNPLSAITYGYDAHGRMNTVTDSRNGTTTFTFNNGDQIVTTTTPVPGSGQSAQTTTSYYDNMDRPWKTVLPDVGMVTNDFHLAGETRTTSGARLYASGNGYDLQGRLKTLTNWSGFPSIGARKTTWNYDSQRGFLTSKVYPDSIGPAYGYTSAGRLKTRLWARSVNTTNSYNAAGDLSSVNYNDSTPAVGIGFDRRGRTTTVTNGATVITSALNDASLLLSDSFTGGVLNGLSVTNGYDALFRRTNLTLNTPLSSINSTFGYDSASRLSTVRAGTNSATYSYIANSPLVSHVLYTNGSTLRMARTNQYDNLNRLTNLVWKAGSTTVASFAQQFNSANQKTRITLVDGSYWLYLYDTLGQVTSAKKYWSDGTLVAGQQAAYDFDDIGNRKSVAAGGDQFGNNLRSATNGANLLNQYTNRTVPGYVNILGSATNTATVTVNNQATYRRSNYFRAELSVTNASAAVWFSATNLAVLNNGTNADIVASTIGNVYVPQTPEAFAYDADGNLTNDGRWSYTWDAENRATSFTRNNSAPAGSKVKLDCQYDYRSRRTQKIVSSWNGSTYVAQSTNKFVYDGWNLIAILDATNGLVQSFTWGTDASGSIQGAGGVGGLISMTIHQGTNAGTYYYCFDGNHNIAALVSVTNGVIAALYEYGGFGELLRATGPVAFVNPFAFSTKFCDWETGFLYYAYRYYDPSTGRWLSRDPLIEEGGFNLYSFVGNHSVNAVDPYGLTELNLNIFWGPGMRTDANRSQLQKNVDFLRSALSQCCKDYKVCGIKVMVKLEGAGATRVDLVETDPEFEIKPNGIAYTSGGQIHWRIAKPNQTVHILAHELGHAGGYNNSRNREDPSHSPALAYLMFASDLGGKRVDKCYCEAIESLAK